MHDEIDEESHINDLSKGYYYLSAKLPLVLIQPGAKKLPGNREFIELYQWKFLNSTNTRIWQN